MDVIDKLNFFLNISVTVKTPVAHTLTKRQSGFKYGINGYVEGIDFFKEPDGVRFQNPGHLASVNRVNQIKNNCSNCMRSGPVMMARNICWTLPKLVKFRATCPTFFVLLVSRSSKQESIPKSIYENLKKTSLITKSNSFLQFFLLQQQ